MKQRTNCAASKKNRSWNHMWVTSVLLANMLSAGGGYMQVEANDSGTNIIVKLRQTGFGELSVVGSGTVTNFEQTSGVATFADASVLTNADLYGGRSIIGYNGTAITALNVYGGSHVIRRAATTANINGNVEFAREDTTASTGISATTINHSAGRILWNGNNITTYNALGTGVLLDWTQSKVGFTITTLNAPVQVVDRLGLRQGNNVNRFGATVVVTTLNIKGGEPGTTVGGGNEFVR
jgi:hypothetical protein